MSNYLVSKDGVLKSIWKGSFFTKGTDESVDKFVAQVSYKYYGENGDRHFIKPKLVDIDTIDKYDYLCIRPTMTHSDNTFSMVRHAIAIDIDEPLYLDKRTGFYRRKDFDFYSKKKKHLRPNLIIHDKYYQDAEGNTIEYDLFDKSKKAPKVHLVYLLDKPCYLTYKKEKVNNLITYPYNKALNDKVKKIEKSICNVFGADSKFVDILIKNPFDLDSYKVLSLEEEPYSLEKLELRAGLSSKTVNNVVKENIELKEKIKKEKKKSDKKVQDRKFIINDIQEMKKEKLEIPLEKMMQYSLEDSIEALDGKGRNSILFRTGIFLCYRYNIVDMQGVCDLILKLRDGLTQYIPEPLPEDEVSTISKSIYKRVSNRKVYEKSNEIKDFTEEEFDNILIRRSLSCVNRLKGCSIAIVKSKIVSLQRTINKYEAFLDIINSNMLEFSKYFKVSNEGLKGSDLMVFAIEKYYEKRKKTINKSMYYELMKDLKTDSTYIFGSLECRTLRQKYAELEEMIDIEKTITGSMGTGDTEDGVPKIVNQLMKDVHTVDDYEKFKNKADSLSREFLDKIYDTYGNKHNYLTDTSFVKYVAQKLKVYIKTKISNKTTFNTLAVNMFLKYITEYNYIDDMDNKDAIIYTINRLDKKVA